ncbi:MAG TPA: hypothetical protein VGU02_04880 [Gaiellaceae bacterium]|nr:hypothetical protein [Gaiellaceae bacterium]
MKLSRAFALAVIGAALLTVPAAATTSRVLATQDWWPVQAPSSDMIAFTRVYPNHMEVWTVDTERHRVVHVATAAGQLFPTWLADGDLAYASGGAIWVVHPNGTHRHRYPTAAGATAPAARPDSTDIAYVAGGDLFVGGNVWALNVIGRPAWSSDGTLLAFRRDDGIYVIQADGTTMKVADAFRPGDPVWSPNSHEIAFIVGSEIRIAGPDVVAYAAVQAHPGISALAWGTDGRRVAYTWLGGVNEVTLPGTDVHVASSAGVGVSYTAEGILEYSGARPACPGHKAIVLGSRLETGSCLVSGTAKADVIEGTPLWGDVIRAGAGNDRIHANDGHTDRVDCGPGRDTVWADKTDRLTRCEVIHR